MREIFFTPGNFEQGASYVAELSFNGEVVQTMTPIPNVQNKFVVTIPGAYVLMVKKLGANACGVPTYVEAWFPLVSYSDTNVNCDTNTYQYIIILSNPNTAGTGIQYGWSLLNQKNSVTNWTEVGTFTVPADDISRFFFVRNDSGCVYFISSSEKSPCATCTLTVTNVIFSCG